MTSLAVARYDVSARQTSWKVISDTLALVTKLAIHLLLLIDIQNMPVDISGTCVFLEELHNFVLHGRK